MGVRHHQRIQVGWVSRRGLVLGSGHVMYLLTIGTAIPIGATSPIAVAISLEWISIAVQRQNAAGSDSELAPSSVGTRVEFVTVAQPFVPGTFPQMKSLFALIFAYAEVAVQPLTGMTEAIPMRSSFHPVLTLAPTYRGEASSP